MNFPIFLLFFLWLISHASTLCSIHTLVLPYLRFDIIRFSIQYHTQNLTLAITHDRQTELTWMGFCDLRKISTSIVRFGVFENCRLHFGGGWDEHVRLGKLHAKGKIQKENVKISLSRSHRPHQDTSISPHSKLFGFATAIRTFSCSLLDSVSDGMWKETGSFCGLCVVKSRKEKLEFRVTCVVCFWLKWRWCESNRIKFNTQFVMDWSERGEREKEECEEYILPWINKMWANYTTRAGELQNSLLLFLKWNFQ